jgi:hypothetical protein
MSLCSCLALLVYVRAVGGEIGATSALAPKLGPLKLVCVVEQALSLSLSLVHHCMT